MNTFTVQSRDRVHHFEPITPVKRKVIGSHVWLWCKVTRTCTDPRNTYHTPRVEWDWCLEGNFGGRS